MPKRVRPLDDNRDPAPRWAEAEPEAIVAYLSSNKTRVDAAMVRAIRDRAATFYHAEPAQAFLIAAALLKILRRQGKDMEPAARAIAWRCHAEACLFTGRMPQARRAYERATEEARGDDALTGQILVARVSLLALLGEAAEASRLAVRAERLLTRIGDLAYLGKLYVNQGNAHFQKDRYAEALAVYQKAAAVFERAGVRDASTVALLLNQGIACSELARVDEARRFFLRTESRCEQLGLAALGAQARYNRAFLEARGGNYRLALLLLEAAGRVFEDQGIREMAAAAQRARAEIYLDLGMPVEALDLATRAAAAFTQQEMAFDRGG